jgi:hypothetical protein
MIKTSSLSLAAVICCSGMTLPVVAQTTTPQTNTPQVQFVQTAEGIAFNDGVLTLKNAAPMTIFFSDRPERLVGQVRTDQFAKLWTEGNHTFKSDPPNALLSVFNSQGRPTQVVVVLSNPRVEGKNIAYNVRTLNGRIPAQGAESTLFIDSGGAPCNSDDDPSYASYPCWAQNAFSWGK